MIAVHFRKWTYSVPENWNELKRRQLLRIVKVMQHEVENTKGLLLLFRELASIPWYQFFLMRTPHLVEAAEETTGFLRAENTLTKNHLPVYKGYAGPADQLNNIKMAEFCFAEFHFLQYSQTSDVNHLNQLVAILYRPKKLFYRRRLNPDGDARKKFNPNTLEYHAGKIAKWPMHVKLAIMLFYEGCRSQKIKNNPKVFGGSSGDESLHGLWSIMRSVAKGGQFGDFDKVAEQYVDTILMDLNETVDEAERMEAERNRVHLT